MKYVVSLSVDFSGRGNYAIAHTEEAYTMRDLHAIVESLLDGSDEGDIIEIVQCDDDR